MAIIICDTGIALLVYMDGVQHQTLATVMIGFGCAIVFGVYKVSKMIITITNRTNLRSPRPRW